MSQEVRNLGSNAQKILLPKLITWIPQQLDKCDRQAPWMRTMDQEPLKEHRRYNLLELANIDLVEQVKEQCAEPVSVSIRVS